jgi:hypothetical protein
VRGRLLCRLSNRLPWHILGEKSRIRDWRSRKGGGRQPCLSSGPTVPCVRVVGEGDQRSFWWKTRGPEMGRHKDMVQAESRPWIAPLRRPEAQHWRLWDTRSPHSE